MINLDICSYANYKVYERLEYSYIDEENSFPGDIIYYGKQKSTQEYIINGGLLLQKIGEHLQDNNICGIVTYKGKIKIEKFNPMEGTGTTMELSITLEGEQNNDSKENN